MVDTRVTSRTMLAILLFEIVVSGCGDSSPRKTMSELALMYPIL